MKLCNIITVSRRPALRLATAVLAIAPAVFAHAGFHHVMGTVAKVSGNLVTVKTAKGNVDVKFSDKTELTRNDRKAQITDLKPGTRVVAEVPEEGTDKVAQSIRIGAAPRTVAARRSHTSSK